MLFKDPETDLKPIPAIPALPYSALPALDSFFLWGTQLFRPKQGRDLGDGDEKDLSNKLVGRLGYPLEEWVC
jgi:hypothetical protein